MMFGKDVQVHVMLVGYLLVLSSNPQKSWAIPIVG